jgi:hypothetical protein
MGKIIKNGERDKEYFYIYLIKYKKLYDNKNPTISKTGDK